MKIKLTFHQAIKEIIGKLKDHSESEDVLRIYRSAMDPDARLVEDGDDLFIEVEGPPSLADNKGWKMTI